jgi:xylulokinase
VTVLGIDIGTTGAKAIVVGSDGSVLAHAYRDYPLITPEPGWAELDPEAVWRAARAAIRAAVLAVDARPSAIGITGPGEAFIPLDLHDRPLANAIVSLDQRAIALFERVVADLDPGTFERATGQIPLSHYAIFKWLWWREQRSELDHRTVRFASLSGYVAEQLGARPAIDGSLAARPLVFDPISGTWADALLSRLGMDPGRLPPILAPGTMCGLASSKAAGRLGIDPAAPIVLAGLDQACAAFGIELTDDVAMLSVGTTAVLAQRSTPQSTASSIPEVPHVDGRASLAIAGSPGGGSVFRWFREVVAAGSAAVGDRRAGRGPSFEQLVTAAEDRRTSVLFLPHLGGSRLAFDDAAARGAYLGLTFDTDRTDLTRAVLDGVAYEIVMLIERLAAAGTAPHRLLAVGGGARSTAWMQIVSDAALVPIDSTGSSDVAAYGAARLAARSDSSRGPAPLLPPFPIRFTVQPRRSWRDHHVERLASFRAAQQALRKVREMAPDSAGREGARR